jgi:hypothetical protein
MRIPYLLPLPIIAALFALPAGAQDIENDVPISAEATTDVVPGKAADVNASLPGQPAAVAQPKPDRIYTDGALANPNVKAEDLGLASPGQKMTVDTSGDSRK